MAAVLGIEQLAPAVVADGDVGRYGLEFARLGLAFQDGETLNPGHFTLADLDRIDARQWGRLGLQASG